MLCSFGCLVCRHQNHRKLVSSIQNVGKLSNVSKSKYTKYWLSDCSNRGPGFRVLECIIWLNHLNLLIKRGYVLSSLRKCTLCTSGKCQLLQHGCRHGLTISGHQNRARGPIIQNVARSTDEIAACSMLIKCIRRKLFSTGIADSANGAPCSLRSRDVFHKVFGLSSMKFSRTRMEQERNQNKETRLHMRK